MNPALMDVAEETRGWLFPIEGAALYKAALSVPAGPIVEVGSYCGKSTLFLGEAARARGTHVFAVDHHRGSLEMQPGRENHDTAVVDAETGTHDTLVHFRRTIRRALLENQVIAVVAPSTTVARYWSVPVGMVFIDAGHLYPDVHADFEAWAPFVVPGGVLAFHDATIPDIDRVVGEAIIAGFELEGEVETLRILRWPG